MVAPGSSRIPRKEWAWGGDRKTNMFDIKRKSIDWAGRTLTLETGRIARQADGAVLATYGETVVLATVVAARSPKAGIDFFPLTVNYQERPLLPVRFPVASSSARAVPPKRRPWSRA